MINFVTFMRVLVFFCETQVRLAQILRTILMLRMQEMAFPGFKFQKFSSIFVAFGHNATVGFYGWIRPALVGHLSSKRYHSATINFSLS